MARIDIVRLVAGLRHNVAGWRAAGQSVGLVPTMGALHQGHLALVRASQAACDRTIVTIFVNPTQFAPTDDLSRYPRQEAADAALLAELGADLLFAPGVEEIYPPGHATSVSVGGSITAGLDGVHRPGHFTGVATVVSKLLVQAMPDAAFFGEKDWQQLCVIRRMARDLDLPVRIEGVATVREPDGLARSSRNAYLSADQRAVAVALPVSLHQTASHLAAGAPVAATLAAARQRLLDAGFATVDYFSLCDAETLEELTTRPENRPARLFVAARLGSTRLIDNIPVN
jgi:pantoate--beta-alanine ligase